MQIVELKIEDNSLDIFINLINNLKDGIVNSFEIKNHIEEVSNQEQLEIENILNSRTSKDKEISHSKMISIEI